MGKNVVNFFVTSCMAWKEQLYFMMIGRKEIGAGIVVLSYEDTKINQNTSNQPLNEIKFHAIF